MEQEGLTIAVNYWHDMSFGPQFALLSLLRNLTVNPPSLEAALRREQEEAEEQDGESAESSHSDSN